MWSVSDIVSRLRHPSLGPRPGRIHATLDWSYTPVGPFETTIHADEDGVAHFRNKADLEVAVRALVDMALPLRDRWTGAVIDTNGIIVVGFSTCDPRDLHGAWIGVRAGFLDLAAVVGKDPERQADVLIWETIAKAALG